MPSFTRYIPVERSFDPEAIRAMGEAYEKAIAELRGFTPDVIRRTLATRIIDAVSQGESDPARLADAALKGLRIER
jgi:hypothetical protein